MAVLIKQGKVIPDLWYKVETIETAIDLSMNYSILPLSVLLQRSESSSSLESFTDKWIFEELLDKKLLGVWFTADLQPENLSQDVMQKFLSIPLLNIEIEDFNDGRVFSFIRLLRTRYQYKGELRVSGQYLMDQIAMLKACGVDSFVFSEGSDYEHALFILSNTPENTF